MCSLLRAIDVNHGFCDVSEASNLEMENFNLIRYRKIISSSPSLPFHKRGLRYIKMKSTLGAYTFVNLFIFYDLSWTRKKARRRERNWNFTPWGCKKGQPKGWYISEKRDLEAFKVGLFMMMAAAGTDGKRVFKFIKQRQSMSEKPYGYNVPECCPFRF